MRPALVLLFLAPIVLVPTALATTPTCASITIAGPTPVGPYLIQDHRNTIRFDVWAETNLLEGLQRVACLDAAGATVQPDPFVGNFGLDTGGQPICVPRLGCIF